MTDAYFTEAKLIKNQIYKLKEMKLLFSDKDNPPQVTKTYCTGVEVSKTIIDDEWLLGQLLTSITNLLEGRKRVFENL